MKKRAACLIVLALLLACPSYAADGPKFLGNFYEEREEIGDTYKSTTPFYDISHDEVTTELAQGWYDTKDPVGYGSYADAYKRDYSWTGPTTDAAVKWDEVLNGWTVSAGSHAAYPTINTVALHLKSARGYNRNYCGQVIPSGTQPAASGYRIGNAVYDYLFPLGYEGDSSKMRDKIFAADGGTIASMTNSGHGHRVKNGKLTTYSYNTSGLSWELSDEKRINCDQWFAWEKVVVTVTGTGGGGGGGQGGAGGEGGDASATVNFDMDKLREILIEVFRDYGKYVGGGGGGGSSSGGGGGGGVSGSISGSVSGTDSEGNPVGGTVTGTITGGSVTVTGTVNGNQTISGNIGVSGTIDIGNFKSDLKAAVIDALNTGKLKIDWSLFAQTFPNGLDVDWSKFSKYTSEPTINITRSVSADTPVSADKGVELTITAKDTNKTDGEGNMTVIIDGVKYEGSGDTVTQKITVNTNRTVTVVAIDGNGNSKNYDVEIGNIDEEGPKVDSITASRENWTKDPVDVVIKATDDQKLADKAYRWFFQSTTEQGDGQPTKPANYYPIDGVEYDSDGWCTNTSFPAPDSGNVWCEVKDATGQITLSPPCYVRCIDKIAPQVAGHQLDPPDGEMAAPGDGVTVTIDIDNVGDPASKDASPLASLMVQWEIDYGDGEGPQTTPWRSSQSLVVHKNCSIRVRVRDSLGNESKFEDYETITVGNLADAKPRITGAESTATAGEWVRPPVVLSVNAEKGNDGTPADLAERPFSWDNGHTWLLPNHIEGDVYRSDYTVYHNGQYTVMVRDELGTITERTFIVSNIDEIPPEVDLFTYKDLPDDWDTARDGEGTPDDYVWRLKMTATDRESGLDFVQLHFGGDNAVTTDSTFNIELQEPGIYAVTAYDKSGNSTYAEKSITFEALGEAGGAGARTYVDIKAPVGGTGEAAFTGSSIGDLVYSKNGVYNMKTGVYQTYSATNTGYDGIEVHFTVTASSSHWITGYATFGSGRYPVEVNGTTAGARGARDMQCVVKIPASALVQDSKNGKLIVVMQEYSTDPGGNENPNHAKLLKEGTATLFTNVQVNPPKINYTYNRSTKELTVVATSAVAGIAPGYPKYSYGGGDTEYTGPFVVTPESGTLILKAVDNCQLSTELTLDISTLSVTGEGGGTLPTQNASGDTVSYYMSGRSAEIYIIGGTKQNTNVIPSSTVVNSVLGH